LFIKKGNSTVWVIVISTVVCALALGLLLRLGAREHALNLLEWIDSLEGWGPLVFVGVETLVVILLLPGIVFTLGAGFLFGTFWGTLCVVVGQAIGGAVAFMIARTFLKKQTSKLLQKHQGIANLDKRVLEKGWKIIMLTRMIPFFPFKLSNYCFGVMRFSLRDYVIGTTIGVIPISVTTVYAGSLAKDLATMGSLTERSGLTWAMYGIGLVALVVAVGMLAKSAQKKLNFGDEP